MADEGLAQGWLSRRFEREGWPWFDELLARDLIPDKQALILLASQDYPKATGWVCARQRGTSTCGARLLDLASSGFTAGIIAE